MSEPDPPDPKAHTLGDPQTATAAELFEAAAHHEGRARFHEAMWKSSLALAEGYRQRAESRLAVERGLNTRANPGTVNTMNASPISNVRRSKAAIVSGAHKKHPFVAMLMDRNLTVAKAAEAIGRPRSTVQSWYKKPRDTGYREIPWECAEKIRELYGLPHSAWHSVGPRE